jgi:hypothetical protein
MKTMKHWMGAVAAIVAAGILPLAQAAPPATGPRFLEEHPESARTTVTPPQFDSPAFEAELITEPPPAEVNAAVINSPRFREENPELFRGVVAAVPVESTSPQTAVTPRVVEEHPEIVRQNQVIEPEVIIITEEPIGEDQVIDEYSNECPEGSLYENLEEETTNECLPDDEYESAP